MKLGSIYEFVVKKGLEKDPRTKKELEKTIDPKYPYADTKILYGDKNRDIRTIMVGIDVDGSELLSAYLLNEKGAGIDLVMSHHPSGTALSNLHRVMHVQTSVLHHLGIDQDVAKALMKERISEVYRRFSAMNCQKSVDIARLFNIPFMCAHTPADNHVTHFLKRLFEKKKPKKVLNVLQLLRTIPEYQDAVAKGAGPSVIAGKEKNKAGKIFVDMTGGTEGSKKIFARLSQAGVGTIIGMHLSEEHVKMAKAEFINVIIAGHIASDNLGLNLLLDELLKKFDFNIITCSGFFRVNR